MREEKSQYERKGFKGFFRKYFCEGLFFFTEFISFSLRLLLGLVFKNSKFLGQHLDENSSPREIPKDADFLDIVLIKYRKYVAVLIPLVVMQVRLI